MESTRRAFVKYAGMFAGLLSLSGTTVLLTACGNIYATILAYTTAGITAFQSIVDLLAGAGVIPVGTGAALDLIVVAVKAAFADIQAAVAAYDAAPASQKLTLGGRVSVAIQVAEAQIQTFWNDLKIPDAKLASLVQGLLGIILSTLAAFLPQLPKPAGQNAKVLMAASLSNRVSYAPQKRTVGQFKHDFNEVMVANGKPKVF